MEIPEKQLSEFDKIIQQLIIEFTPINKARFTKKVGHLLQSHGIEERPLITFMVKLALLEHIDSEPLRWMFRRVNPDIGSYWDERSGIYGWYKESQYQAVRLPLKILSETVGCQLKETDDDIWWKSIPCLHVDFYGFAKEADFWRGEGFSPALEFPYWYTKDEEGMKHMRIRYNLVECGFAKAAPYFEGCKEWYRNVGSKYYIEDNLEDSTNE